MARSPASTSQTTTGTLRIGDQWNAINIIAHSQTHPLKAICELTENAIDAGATQVHILRRRHKGDVYLEVVDNGRGVSPDDAGHPDFLRIATHLCDSMKRHLDATHRVGVHGEFGIGLLSFWSLGSGLRMIAGGPAGSLYELELTRGGPTYTIRPVRGQLPTGGTRVVVGPLLEATKKLVTGEKVARYLSAELRDRIRTTGVKIQVVDRVSRSEKLVTPREFDGERLELPRRCQTPRGDLQVELYLRCESSQPDAGIALCKDGTRVLRDIGELLPFQHAPWNDGRLEGLLDFEPLTLAPGTRSGIVADEAFDALIAAATALEPEILEALAQREQAETDRASRQILKQVHKAFVTALADLPSAEYIFFDIPRAAPGLEHRGGLRGEPLPGDPESVTRAAGKSPSDAAAPLLPLDPGPLHAVRITPRQPRRLPGGECQLTAVARDALGIVITDGVQYAWRVVEGDGRLECDPEAATCRVTAEGAGVVTIELVASEAAVRPAGAAADAWVAVSGGNARAAGGNSAPGSSAPEISDRVTVKFLEDGAADGNGPGGRGLPSYRLEPEHGQPWRSRYDARANEIIINSSHRDFLSSKASVGKHRRYIGKLYAKEVVLSNFPHESPAQALERLIEVTLRTEDAL
jgi:hypothetical protein